MKARCSNRMTATGGWFDWFRLPDQIWYHWFFVTCLHFTKFLGVPTQIVGVSTFWESVIGYQQTCLRFGIGHGSFTQPPSQKLPLQYGLVTFGWYTSISIWTKVPSAIGAWMCLACRVNFFKHMLLVFVPSSGCQLGCIHPCSAGSLELWYKANASCR